MRTRRTQESQLEVNCAHFIPYLDRRFGGPVFFLRSLAEEIVSNNSRFVVFSTIASNENDPVVFPKAVSVESCRSYHTWGFRYSPGLKHRIRTHLNPSGLIHSHGLWTYINWIAHRSARLFRLPHIISTHGMLSKEALRWHAKKKWFVAAAFQRSALSQASCLHATSERELEEIRAFGLELPVVVTPPGFQDQPNPEILDTIRFRAQQGIREKNKVLLFLGRIYPIKGLLRLVTAWARIKKEHPEWILVLAGPDEGGYRSELEDALQRLHCAESVRFTGFLDHLEKWNAFAVADLFVMPSDFENFCIAIAEALSAGIPVVASNRTPWQVLEREQCGWWIQSDVDSLAETLHQAMKLEPKERRKIGDRARKLFVKLYGPSGSGHRMIDVYRWLVHLDKKPDCVITD